MRASETARSGSFPTAAGMSRDSTELFPSFRPRSFPTDIRDGDRRELREPSVFAMDARPERAQRSRNMTSYCRSSWRSASLATPETVPVNSPVAANKTGLLRASANTGTTVSVNVRTPDASLKRPVPPVI